MKKTYINPTTQVIELKTRQSVLLNASGETNATSGNLSRRNDIDFDDFDEEY